MTKMYLVCNKIESSHNYVRYSLTLGPNVPEWDGSMNFREVNVQYLMQEIPLVDEDTKVCVTDTLALLGFKPEDIPNEFFEGREYLVMDIDVHRAENDDFFLEDKIKEATDLGEKLSKQVNNLLEEVKQSSLNLGGELKSII